MAGEKEEWNWPMSGNEGPDVEWEHVPIPDPIPPPSSISSNEKEDGVKEDNKGEGELPSVEGIQLGGGKEEKGALPKTPKEEPKEISTPKVRTFERYIPTPEEIKALPDDMEQIFDKYGDDIILEDDEDGNNLHIYYHFGTHEGKKHYKCIKKDCGSGLLIEEIFQPSPPPSPPLRRPRNPPPPPPTQEDHQEDGKEGAKKKKRKPKKKSGSKKTIKEVNLPENEDWNKELRKK